MKNYKFRERGSLPTHEYTSFAYEYSINMHIKMLPVILNRLVKYHIFLVWRWLFLEMSIFLIYCCIHMPIKNCLITTGIYSDKI